MKSGICMGFGSVQLRFTTANLVSMSSGFGYRLLKHTKRTWNNKGLATRYLVKELHRKECENATDCSIELLHLLSAATALGTVADPKPVV